MPLLECRAVTKSYGPRRVLSQVDLAVDAGEVLGLIGPNGSGKSTLMNTIVGRTGIDAGTILFDGQDVAGHRLEDRRRLGISMKSQMPSFVSTLTVAENLRLVSNYERSFARWARPRRDVAHEHLARSPLAEKGDALASDLSHGEQQWLNLLATFSRQPRLILLDEPAAGLNEHERETTRTLIMGLKPTESALVIIDHDLDLIQRMCDRITVLHNGDVIATGTPEQVRSDAAVRDAYLDGRRRD